MDGCDIHGGNFRFHSGVTGVVEGFLPVFSHGNGVTPCGATTLLLTGVKDAPIGWGSGVESESGVVCDKTGEAIVLAGVAAKPGCNNF